MKLPPECLIASCPWVSSDTPETTFESDDMRIAHLWSKHALTEMDDELVRRGRVIRAGIADPDEGFSLRREFAVLVAAKQAAKEFPDDGDPT